MMRNLTISVAAAAAMAFLFAPSLHASAIGNLGKLTPPSVTAPVEPVACRGRPGPHCPPGRHWVCGRYGHRCWCAPC
jgi:hypothetical protein